jgi:hypothetical protein
VLAHGDAKFSLLAAVAAKGIGDEDDVYNEVYKADYTDANNFTDSFSLLASFAAKGIRADDVCPDVEEEEEEEEVDEDEDEDDDDDDDNDDNDKHMNKQPKKRESIVGTIAVILDAMQDAHDAIRMQKLNMPHPSNDRWREDRFGCT